MAAFSAFCFIISLWQYVSLLRYMYAMKALLLFLISLVQLGVQVSLYMTKIGKIHNPVESFGTDVTYALAIVAESLHSVHAFLGAIMLHEIYLCMCDTQKRDLLLSVLLQKCCLATGIVLLFCGLQEAARAWLSAWLPEDTKWSRILEMTVPIHAVLNVIITGAILYFAVQILMSQRKSSQFRKGNASKTSSGGFLIALVLNNAIFHLCKCLIPLIRKIWSWFLLYDIDYYAVTENAIGIEDFSAGGLSHINAMYIYGDVPGHVDLLFVLLLNLHKKFAQK